MQDWTKKLGSISEDKLRGYSEGMVFPATKDQIVEHARKQRLPREVLEKLEKLPDKTYTNMGDLISSAAKGSDYGR